MKGTKSAAKASGTPFYITLECSSISNKVHHANFAAIHTLLILMMNEVFNLHFLQHNLFSQVMHRDQKIQR